MHFLAVYKKNAFFAYLVQHNWFSSVTISCLVAGHTHEDIDAVFSTWEDYLRDTSVYSLPHFIELVPKMYPKEISRPIPQLLTFVFEFKAWFDSTHCLLSMTGHSQLHAFYLKKDHDGVARIWYKDYHSTGQVWKGETESQGVTIFHHLPTGEPSLLPPTPLTDDFLKKFEKI